MQPMYNPFTRVFQLSLASFLLAALTGFFYRYGMIFNVPGDLNLVNIRHAHSHLMFFNWITPPLMAWMVMNLQQHSNKVIRYSGYKICLYSMLFLGFLTWPFFLFYGYHGVSAGNLQLPLAAIISGLVMITWYWFAWLYFHDRNKAKTILVVQLFDAAVIALIISSIGAWGVSVFQFGNSSNPLFSTALTHFFLSVFTEGWAILGVLGLIWSRIDLKTVPQRVGWLWKPVLLGSMLITPLGFSQSIITIPMLYSAKTGLFLIAGSLTIHFFYFVKANIRPGIVWYSVIGLLAVKILIQAGSILPFDFWIGNHGLRILYLHVLFAGICNDFDDPVFAFYEHGTVWGKIFFYSFCLAGHLLPFGDKRILAAKFTTSLPVSNCLDCSDSAFFYGRLVMDKKYKDSSR